MAGSDLGERGVVMIWDDRCDLSCQDPSKEILGSERSVLPRHTLDISCRFNTNLPRSDASNNC